MKEIKVEPGIEFHNNLIVHVIDFPNEQTKEERTRCKITCEYSEYDVSQLIKRGLDIKGAEKYYEDWLYGTIKACLGTDFSVASGWNQVMDIIKKHISEYY